MNALYSKYQSSIKLAITLPILIKIAEYYLINGYDGIFNHLNKQTYLMVIDIIKNNMTYYAIVLGAAIVAHAIAYKNSFDEKNRRALYIKMKKTIK